MAKMPDSIIENMGKRVAFAFQNPVRRHQVGGKGGILPLKSAKAQGSVGYKHRKATQLSVLIESKCLAIILSGLVFQIRDTYHLPK